MAILTTSAARLAASRWAANLEALRGNQPDVADELGSMPDDVEWVFARDRTLTARNADATWWGACSVPRRAAEKLLLSLEPSTLVSAYLAPTHAALLHVARERIGLQPALFAVVPTPQTARMLLATGEFADEIQARRLWFIVGQDWAERMHRLLIKHPGLPPAGRYIRTKLIDAAVSDAMIATAQNVLAQITSERAAELDRLQAPSQAVRTMRRLLVISPTRYRLWDDAAAELANAVELFASEPLTEVVSFDSDDPLSSSPLALALAAADCDAVVAANVYRADATGLVPSSTPWITWATRGAVAPFDLAAGADQVIVARSEFQSAATGAGWPGERVSLGQRAMPNRPAPSSPPHLAIIADLPTVEIPELLDDLSSHRLLWEFVDNEVDTDPFVIGNDPVQYLLSRATMIEIEHAELDLRMFVDGLIVPRWQRSIARRLVAAEVPVVLHGVGWAAEPALAAHAAGEVIDQLTFEHAIDAATVLLHVWPGISVHPIDDTGRTVIRVAASWSALLKLVKAALSAPPAIKPRPSPDLVFALGRVVPSQVR